MKRLLVLTAATLTLALAPPASAGSYDVWACHAGSPSAIGGNASWVVDLSSPYMSSFVDCPSGLGMTTKLNLGSGRVPYGATSRFTFTAPPGTAISRFRGRVEVTGKSGYWAGIVDASLRWLYCGSGCVSFDWSSYLPISVPMETPRLYVQVTCGNPAGCPRTAQDGYMAMREVIVTIVDYVLPTVAITGGSVVAPGWHRGDQTVSLAARDASGVRWVELKVDNALDTAWERPCDASRPRRCDDFAVTRTVPSSMFRTDGEHTITVRALDAGGNESVTSRRIFVDQTAPLAPIGLQLGDEAWRPSNGFDIGWENPKAQVAPIAAARYSVCPLTTPVTSSKDCVEGRRAGANISELRDVKVPRAGAWRLSVWLEDAAGNADPQRAALVTGLRFDDQSPELAFAPASASDPTRVRVIARDAVSGVAAGQIEARREGEDAWRSLRTQQEDGGFSAWLDDEVLPKGDYELRARAVDAAGNERSTLTESAGGPAERTLPLRVMTRLAVGKPRRVRARNANGKRRYRTVLQVDPRAHFGRTIPLTGRLTTPGANPLAGVPVEVWERVELAGAAWRRIGELRTSGAGRFRFKALRGPSRTLRFRYPGTATIRPRSAAVELGVRAVTSIRATRPRVVNGEEVRFHGRLKGRQTGATGKLIHLQVFTRGGWSTFATPRANRATGRWSVPYRFTATRGLVRYRFRAVIPREASFPYETGHSRSVRVTVRGL